MVVVVSLLAGSLVCTNAVGEIKRSTLSTDRGDYIKVLVSDENWQPDPFEQGIVIPASYSKGVDIVLDGVDNESAWQDAEEITLPLSYGSTKEAQLKALYTDEDVLLRVRWPDTSEDRLHHPWVWNEELGNYEAGPQVEDSLILSFEVGCEWFPSFLSGYEFDFDGWFWKAGRTDPASLAIDMYGSIKRSTPFDHTPYPSRNREREWNLKFTDVNDSIIDQKTLHNTWDEMERKYEIWPVDGNTLYFLYLVDGHRDAEVFRQLPLPASPVVASSDMPPQFGLIELKDNAEDVQAKGHWEDGYWTVELRRKRITEAGLSYDVQFERLTQFSLHIFDHVERLDQSSESPRLFLQFLEKEPSESAPDPQLVRE